MKTNRQKVLFPRKKPIYNYSSMYLTVLAPFLISVALIIFAASEIVHDIARRESFPHIFIQTLIFFLGFLLNIYLIQRAANHIRDLRQKNSQIDEALKFTQGENKVLLEERQRLKDGLYLAIQEQMTKWDLSPSETEIGFLLIKGLTNKEIADIRKTSESTVRLQCSSIYRKSNLNSRSELSAYFLEDLL